MESGQADGLVLYSAPLPPPLLFKQQQQAALVDLDTQFGNMLCRLMDSQITAAEAITELQQHTAALVEFYRAEAADELAPAARRLNIARMAQELEGQAATWQLLQALYCTDGMPAGVYESAANVGERLTMRQLLADEVNGDDRLRRFAQVVMWLEALASQRLPQDPVQLAATCRFGSQEGVWKDTLRGLGAASRMTPGGSDAELDPDAVSRDQLKLALGDQQNEQRLAAWAWRLLRAGRFKEACELCANAGQPWRAVSLAGAGPWGPLPVGDAALKASTAPEQEGDMLDPAEEVAAEVDSGAASARLAWRWACCAAAAAAGSSADGDIGKRYEAALYGALCGDVRAMLPACDSWEDEVWAYCRAALELNCESATLAGCQAADADPQAQAAAQSFYLGHAGDNSEAEVPLDLLEGVADLAARCGYTKQPPNKQLLREGLAAMDGHWPLSRLAVAGNAVLVPNTFNELYQVLDSSANAAVASAARSDQHLLQVQVMSQAWVDLVSQLNSTAQRATAHLQELQDRQQRGPDDADVSMDASGEGYGGNDLNLGLGYGEAGGEGGESLAAAVDVLRFNAHMALVLRALGLLPDPAAVEEQEVDQAALLQAVCSQVICAYAHHLASQPGSLDQVPAYLCHLRLPERRALAARTLATALSSAMHEEQAERLCTLLFAGTQYWYEHQMRVLQQQQDEEDGGADTLQHQLFGDLRPEEARLLLQHNVYSALSHAASSPKQRCDTLRWMMYTFTAAAAAAQGAGGADAEGLDQQQQLTWQGCWADALGNSLGLATQLALNPGFGGPGVAYLLQAVVPVDFAAAATAAALAAADAASGVESSAVSRAVGVDVVEAAGQLQVQRGLLALTFWQHYADLEGRYQAWKQARALLLGGKGGGGAAESAMSLDESVGLVQDMLQLAGGDVLRLSAPQWLAELVNGMAAAAAGAEQEEPAAAAAVVVSEGDWLCLPQFDAPVYPQKLLAMAEGTVEQVLGLVPYSELQLAVTVAPHQPGRTGPEAAAQGRDISLPFRRLEEPEVSYLKSCVDPFLQSALASCPDVAFSAGITPDPSEPLSGCLLVKLNCYSSSSSGSSSGRALDSRELQAWHDMVCCAVALLEAGSARVAGGADEEEGWEEGEGGAVPRLSLVYLNGSLSTQLAISRRRTTSKLLRRSAKVLSVLTRQGYRGSEVDSLLELASAGDNSQGLLSQLSQGDAAALLDTLTQVLAEVQDGA